MKGARSGVEHVAKRGRRDGYAGYVGYEDGLRRENGVISDSSSYCFVYLRVPFTLNYCSASHRTICQSFIYFLL